MSPTPARRHPGARAARASSARARSTPRPSAPVMPRSLSRAHAVSTSYGPAKSSSSTPSQSTTAIARSSIARACTRCARAAAGTSGSSITETLRARKAARTSLGRGTILSEPCATPVCARGVSSGSLGACRRRHRCRARRVRRRGRDAARAGSRHPEQDRVQPDREDDQRDRDPRHRGPLHRLRPVPAARPHTRVGPLRRLAARTDRPARAGRRRRLARRQQLVEPARDRHRARGLGGPRPLHGGRVPRVGAAGRLSRPPLGHPDRPAAHHRAQRGAEPVPPGPLRRCQRPHRSGPLVELAQLHVARPLLRAAPGAAAFREAHDAARLAAAAAPPRSRERLHAPQPSCADPRSRARSSTAARPCAATALWWSGVDAARRWRRHIYKVDFIVDGKTLYTDHTWPYSFHRTEGWNSRTRRERPSHAHRARLRHASLPRAEARPGPRRQPTAAARTDRARSPAAPSAAS